MKIKWLLIFSLGLLSCGKAGFLGIPKLSEQGSVIWDYNCADALGLDVEYALMAGVYSATIAVPDVGRKVLNQEGEFLFVFDRWRWQSFDGHRFSLFENERVLASDCVAMAQSASDDLRVRHQGLQDLSLDESR